MALRKRASKKGREDAALEEFRKKIAALWASPSLSVDAVTALEREIRATKLTGGHIRAGLLPMIPMASGTTGARCERLRTMLTRLAADLGA